MYEPRALSALVSAYKIVCMWPFPVSVVMVLVLFRHLSSTSSMDVVISGVRVSGNAD